MIPKHMQEMIDELQECETQTEKFQFFIDISEDLPVFDTSERIDENKILGCASDAWVTARKNEDNKIILKGDAEAIISKGFLTFFILGFEDCTADEILSFTINDLSEYNIISSLSPSRANGALSSLNKIHSLVNSL